MFGVGLMFYKNNNNSNNIRLRSRTEFVRRLKTRIRGESQNSSFPLLQVYRCYNNNSHRFSLNNKSLYGSRSTSKFASSLISNRLIFSRTTPPTISHFRVVTTRPLPPHAHTIAVHLPCVINYKLIKSLKAYLCGPTQQYKFPAVTFTYAQRVQALVCCRMTAKRYFPAHCPWSPRQI